MRGTRLDSCVQVARAVLTMPVAKSPDPAAYSATSIPITEFYLLPTRSGFSCRFCSAPLKTTFVDLGMSPLCQTHIAPDQLQEMEPFFPLHAYVCDSCFLVQLQEFVAPEEIFTDYAYFSSYSPSWVEHARRYVDQ